MEVERQVVAIERRNELLTQQVGNMTRTLNF